MIEVKNLVKDYQLGKTKVRALNDVSFKIERGDFLGIVGPSGSGKSTLLNILGLLDKTSQGRVLLDGVDIEGLSPSAQARTRGKRIGFIFQSFNLVPVFNIYENVETALILARDGGDKRLWKERVLGAIAEVGLSEFVKHKPAELSGGQRQRVAIARALVKRPELIIADEPTANLDSKNAFSIIELMRGLNQKEGSTFIFSTHDERVLKYAGRIMAIEDGRLKE